LAVFKLVLAVKIEDDQGENSFKEFKMSRKLFLKVISGFLTLVIVWGLGGCASISDWRAGRYFQHGQDLEKQSQADQALAAYTAAISLNPKLEPAYFKRGMIYFNQGSLEKASADLEREVELNPQNAEAFYRLGLIDLKQKDLAKAHDEFGQAIALNYPDADASYQRGLIHAGVPANPQADANQALADFSQAIQGGMQKADVFYRRGMILASINELDKALTDFDRAIQGGMKQADVFYQRGMIMAGKKDYDKAIADFSQAIRLDSSLVDAYYRQAQAYQANHQPELAFISFTRVIELDPRNGDAYYQHGAYQVEKGKLDEGIKDLDRVIQINDQNIDAYFQRGRAYYRKGELDQALLDFNQVVALNPAYSGIYVERSQVLFDMANYPEAIADLDKVIKENPDETKYRARRGYANFQLRNFDTAIQDYLIQTEKCPESATAFFNLGLAYARKGEWSPAIKNLGQSINLHPTADAYRARGGVYFELREMKAALQDYQKALNLDSQFTGIYLQMSMGALVQGDLIDSIRYAKKYLETTPDAKNVAQIKEWISVLESELRGTSTLNLTGLLPRATDVPADCIPYPEGKAWMENLEIKTSQTEADAYVSNAYFYCAWSKEQMDVVILKFPDVDAQNSFNYYLVESRNTELKSNEELITDLRPGDISYGQRVDAGDHQFNYIYFRRGIVGVYVMTWEYSDAPVMKFEDLVNQVDRSIDTGLLQTTPFYQPTGDLESIPAVFE
jgi:tetratricopeptide (TPR) repeat protein